MKKNDQGTAPGNVSAPAVEKAAADPSFGPFIKLCNQRGISRTRAYQMLATGHFDTFKIGRLRFIMIASLNELPVKMRALAARRP